MKSLRVIALFAALSSTATSSAQQTRPDATQTPADIVAALESYPALVYAKNGDREMQLDLWRPKSRITATLPAIVCIHGGGWRQGDRRSMANLAQYLAVHGYVTASITYRLSGEARFPAAIEDCKAAVRFLRANATKYGINSQLIGVTGLSAGGHLAALLATSGGVKELEGTGGNPEQSSSVQACMAMAAQSDLLTPRIAEISSHQNELLYRPFLGDSQSKVPQTYTLASPRHHLDKSDPPLAFMAGALDDASTHADETRADLQKLGIPTGLTLFPDAPHGFLGQQTSFDIGLKGCVEFFGKHLQTPAH